ncbi:hypothetical protein ACFV5G_27255 [Streptomyces sp. NPDC059766]
MTGISTLYLPPAGKTAVDRSMLERLSISRGKPEQVAKAAVKVGQAAT